MTTAANPQTTTTYRADHVGSLLRPPELLQAREDRAQGRISPDELRQREDQAIVQALEMQRQTGVSVLSDGEYRRGVFADAWDNVLARFTQRIKSRAPGSGTWKGANAAIANATIAALYDGRLVIDKRIDLEQVERLTAHEVPFLMEHAGNKSFKITMPGAGQHYAGAFEPGITDAVYASRDELAMELAEIMRREITALVEAGVPYIQLDSLRYVMQISDPNRRQLLLDSGVNPDAELDLMIAADNASIEGIDRRGSVIGLHMCRGNNRSAWSAEGKYDSVAEKTFSELKVDRLLLEYDDPAREGTFEAIRFVPQDKIVVLGIMSSKLADLESVDDLRRRIDEAAKYHPMEHLAISPQCGFASTAPGNLLTWDEQRRKLERLVETVHKVWG